MAEENEGSLLAGIFQARGPDAMADLNRAVEEGDTAAMARVLLIVQEELLRRTGGHAEIHAVTETITKALEDLMRKQQGAGSPAEAIPNTPGPSYTKLLRIALKNHPFNHQLKNALANIDAGKSPLRDELVSLLAGLYYNPQSVQLFVRNVMPPEKIPPFGKNALETWGLIWDECSRQDPKGNEKKEQVTYSGETFAAILASEHFSSDFRRGGFRGTSANLKQFLDDVAAKKTPQEIPDGLLSFLATAFNDRSYVQTLIGWALPGRNITVPNSRDAGEMWRDIWYQCQTLDKQISGSGKATVSSRSRPAIERPASESDTRVEQLQARVQELEDALESTRRERDSFARQVDTVTQDLTGLARERDLLKRDEIALKATNARLERERDTRINKAFERPSPTGNTRQAPTSSAEAEPASNDVDTLNRWLASGSNSINEILDTLANNFGTRDSVVQIARNAGLSPAQVMDFPNPRMIWSSLFSRLQYSEGSFRQIVSEAVKVLGIKRSKSVLEQWSNGDRQKLSSRPLKKELEAALNQLADNPTSIRKALGDAGLGKVLPRLNLSHGSGAAWSMLCDEIGKGLISDAEFAALIREVKNLK